MSVIRLGRSDIETSRDCAKLLYIKEVIAQLLEMINHRTVLFLMLIAALLLATAGCIQNTPAASEAIPSTAPATSAAQPVLSAAVTPTTSPALTLTSNETLVAFVREAVAYAKANGKARALAEFSNPNGSFVRGELYIYAYDFNGTTLAHPVNPEKIGVNRMYEQAGGVGIVLQNLSSLAMKNGSGFYRFTYINPAHNRTLESKLGYAEKVDDTWWLGSGVYSGPADQNS